jgi:hypothetical protein
MQWTRRELLIEADMRRNLGFVRERIKAVA